MPDGSGNPVRCDAIARAVPVEPLHDYCGCGTDFVMDHARSFFEGLVADILDLYRFGSEKEGLERYTVSAQDNVAGVLLNLVLGRAVLMSVLFLARRPLFLCIPSEETTRISSLVSLWSYRDPMYHPLIGVCDGLDLRTDLVLQHRQVAAQCRELGHRHLQHPRLPRLAVLWILFGEESDSVRLRF